MIISRPMTIKEQPLQAAAYLLPLASGLLLLPAFPPWEQGYLAWAALLPFLWFCHRATPRQAFLGGLLFGLPVNCYLNLYLADVLYAYLTPWLASLAMLLLVAVLSIFYALFACTAALLCRRLPATAAVFAVPALWLLMEWGRSAGFLGYNVGFLGYTQWQYPLLLNLAAAFGYWGLPFCMVAVQNMAVMWRLKSLPRRGLTATAGILVLLILAGLIVPELFPASDRGHTIIAALIQGNSAPEEILNAGGKDVILSRYLELTRRAKEIRPETALVVWPETVVDITRSTAGHRQEMKRLSQELKTAILYGARVVQKEHIYNAIAFLEGAGEDFHAYYKRRLVPFVEYFPLEKLLNQVLDLGFLLGRYTPGTEHNVFQYAFPLAGVVCYESYFGDYCRRFTARGARHLFILTNDAWFGLSIGLEMHAQTAAIRAAETGYGVTQVANSGLTLSFDFRGRPVPLITENGDKVYRSGKARQEILFLELQQSGRRTPYVLLGDYFPAFWGGYLVMALLFNLAGKRKRRF